MNNLKTQKKRFLRKILFSIIFFSIASFVYSQQRPAPPQLEIEVRLFSRMKTLSQEQKNQIFSELETIKKSRELFRGTLSKKQQNILRNNNLSLFKKRELLIRTFTPSQRDIINKADTRMKTLIHNVKTNFSEKQRKELHDLKRKYSKIRQGDPRGSRRKVRETENRRKRSPSQQPNRRNR